MPPTDPRPTDAARPPAAPSGRLVLADDHALFLEALRAALEARPGIEVVAEAANGLEAIALVRRHRPDVAVLDDSMPGASGLETVAEAGRWSPETRFVILSGAVTPARLAEMRARGVRGILLKSMAPDAICEGIETVLGGGTVLGAEVAATLDAAETDLTARERQVLEGIARGSSTSAIAESLALSAKTVDSHRTSLMRKLGARNVATLLVEAIRRGLIDVS